MKKKIFLFLVTFLIVNVCVGCGKKSEYQERKSNYDNADQWSDDMVIAFSDEGLVKKIREITGKSEGNITYGDVKYITELSISGISNVESIKYFSSMKDLSIETKDDDLSALSYCKELEKLDISSEAQDYDFINDFENIEYVNINAKENVGKISIKGLNKLKSISIGGNVESYSFENLSELSGVGLRVSENTSEVTFSDIDKLGYLHIYSPEDSHFDNGKTIVDLGNITIIENLSIENGDMLKEIIGNRVAVINFDIHGEGELSEVCKNFDFSESEKIFTTSISSIENSENISYLQTLEIRNCDSLEKMPKIDVVDTVKILFCDKLSSLNGIENISRINNLYIGCNEESMDDGDNMASLRDISAVAKISEVEKLWIAQAPITDLTPLCDTESLKYLCVDNCSNLSEAEDYMCLINGSFSDDITMDIWEFGQSLTKEELITWYVSAGMMDEPVDVVNSENGKILIEINNSTTVMSLPDSNSGQLMPAVRTEIFEYLGTSRDGEWYKANVKDSIGWIRVSQSSLLDVSKEEYDERMLEYKLNSGELIQLRDGRIITEEEYINRETGDGLYGVHDIKGEWYDISEENINRILLQENNEAVSTQADEIRYVTTAANDGGVNMRSGPGTEFDILIEMIPNGEKMAVSAEDFSTTGKIWYKVTYHEVEGWVSASQIK